jgi:hypothetical protein
MLSLQPAAAAAAAAAAEESTVDDGAADVDADLATVPLCRRVISASIVCSAAMKVCFTKPSGRLSMCGYKRFRCS